VVSYLSYIDPTNPREFAWIRRVEYFPFFVLLAWAVLGGFCKRSTLRKIKLFCKNFLI
jgi:hypothetical protein